MSTSTIKNNLSPKDKEYQVGDLVYYLSFDNKVETIILVNQYSSNKSKTIKGTVLYEHKLDHGLGYSDTWDKEGLLIFKGDICITNE